MPCGIVRPIRSASHSWKLNKQESNDKVLEAIRTVLAGKLFFSPEVTQRLVSQAIGGVPEKKTLIERLTDRELQVFRMIGEGVSTGIIANNLYLSTHTIDTHRDNIKRKLELKTAAELSRAAVQWVLENS
ncbi:MAG: nreC 2 [Planctomycetaceae bacterium]|nr:nreC 2 [Planctomycetaceae bacterium]